MNVLSTTRATFLRRQMALIAARSLSAHQGIGRSLDVHHARVLADRALDVFRVGRIDVSEFEAEVGHDLIEQARGSAVEIVAANYVIARFAAC